MDRYLRETSMLDFSTHTIQRLIEQSGCGIPCRIHGFTIDRNTYIQSEGINQDFDIYDSPDALLKEHGQEMSLAKAFLYRNLGRHLMNANIRRIRNKCGLASIRK